MQQQNGIFEAVVLQLCGFFADPIQLIGPQLVIDPFLLAVFQGDFDAAVGVDQKQRRKGQRAFADSENIVAVSQGGITGFKLAKRVLSEQFRCFVNGRYAALMVVIAPYNGPGDPKPVQQLCKLFIGNITSWV